MSTTSQAVDGHLDKSSQDDKNGPGSRARVHTDGPGHGAGGLGADELQHSGPAASAATLLVQGLENDPDVVRLTIEGVKKALRAEQRFFNKGTQAWEVVPDFRVVMVAAEFVFKNLVGLPVQKVETRNLNITQTSPIEMTSPAAIEAMERYLAKVKRQVALTEKRVEPAGAVE